MLILAGTSKKLSLDRSAQDLGQMSDKKILTDQWSNFVDVQTTNSGWTN